MFYNKRVRILTLITGLLMLIPIFRLAQIQLFSSPSYRAEIQRLQRGTSQQTQTLRGRILDRKGLEIASEKPLLKLYVTYQKITCFADPNVQQAMRLSAQKSNNPGEALAEVNEEIKRGLDRIAYLLALCDEIGFSSAKINDEITSRNQAIWDIRTFQAWRNNCMATALFQKNKDRIGSTYGDLARADFRNFFPDPNERKLKVSDYRTLEMQRFFPLVELRSEESQFLALTRLEGMDGVEVTPQASRDYPYKTVASQLIGWVGPATQERDIKAFENDRLAKYQDGELCGREDGIERVCEPILRGRRGELTYDMDRNLVEHAQQNAVFGQDVRLTLDIDLQQAIETRLMTFDHRPCCTPGKAAVVLDVRNNEILALVSVPVYDLNTARYRYAQLRADKAKPMLNRALNKNYPPGSVAKPLVAIAGLESGTITPRDVIGCPSAPPPKGWPRCWTQKQQGYGHDALWPSQNHARNAIKGSCNIYFSHLAERIELRTLQTWFSRFGYGRTVPLTRPLQFSMDDRFDLRTLNQGAGRIIADAGNRKLAGIGQSNMRVTPLQVANSMATLARGGQFLNPTLFQMDTSHSAASHAPENLGISQDVLHVVLDGMNAVVSERHGSAYAAFHEVDPPFPEPDFARYGVQVYGKTGSTENPENAWFSGFARAKSGQVLAIAVVVEGGLSGGTDAAPLARTILGLCVTQGYLGAL